MAGATSTTDGAASILEVRDVDPYGLYARLRDGGPVSWDEGLRGWLVTSYDDCAFVERREDLFGPGMGTLRCADEITGRRSVLTLEGEPHAALHRFLARAMTPAAIEPLRPEIRAMADALLDELAAEGNVELVARYAMPLPIAVVARVVGLEHDAAALLRSRVWMEAVLAWRHSYGLDDEITEAARVAARASVDDVLPTVRARREDRRDDLISALWEVGPSILPDWTEDDVLDQCRVLFEAGAETTSHLIATCVALLAADEALERRVREEEGALIRLIEEALRLWTVVHMRVRVAREDVELGGVAIRAGERVHPVNAAGNRDPARYEDPDRLDIDRRGYASHLAFNVGARHCVGAALARLEAVESLGALLARVPRVRLDADREPPGYRGFVSRGFRPLWLVLS
jgi:cytochrome P450